MKGDARRGEATLRYGAQARRLEHMTHVGAAVDDRKDEV